MGTYFEAILSLSKLQSQDLVCTGASSLNQSLCAGCSLTAPRPTTFIIASLFVGILL